MGTNSHRRARWRALSEDEEAVEQVGVEVEESAAASVSGPATQLDDSGFVEFFSAGAPVTGDFRCPDCGYGAVVHRTLPPCPMCGGTVWESLGPPTRLLD